MTPILFFSFTKIQRKSRALRVELLDIDKLNIAIIVRDKRKESLTKCKKFFFCLRLDFLSKRLKVNFTLYRTLHHLTF